MRAVDESTDPDAVRGIDWARDRALGARPRRAGLRADRAADVRAGSDPIVWVPLVGGIGCFRGLHLVGVARARSDAAAGAVSRRTTSASSTWRPSASTPALIGAFFFITLFLQQVAGYSAFQAGAATTPVTVHDVHALGRFGALASRIGPRLPMGVRPARRRGRAGAADRCSSSDPNYLVDVLPALILFGLGLSMTVAPLTTTVLDAVEERHVGRRLRGQQRGRPGRPGRWRSRSSARSSRRSSRRSLDSKVADSSPSAQAQAAIDDAKDQPLSGGDVGERSRRRGEHARRRHPRLVGIGLPPRDADRRRADGRRRRDRTHLGSAIPSRPPSASHCAAPVPRRRRASAAAAPGPTRSPSRVARVSAARFPAREDLQRHPADRAKAPRQLHRGDPPVRRGPGRAAATGERSTASSTCTRSPSPTTRPSCASASTTRRRSCSPPGSTRSAASSSASPTSASTPS